jgi:hypothetical protein
MAKKAAVKIKTVAIKRDRDQSGRRDTVEQKLTRFMNEKIVGRLDKRTIQTKRIGGVLIEDAIAKILKSDSKRPLTQGFANGLVEQYGAKNDLFEGLELAMDAHIRVPLIDALTAATHAANNTRDPEDLLSFLQNSSKLSVAEFVGLIQAIYACRHMSRINKDRVFIVVLKHLERHTLLSDASFETVIKAAATCFDASLYAHYCRLSARGQDWKVWLQRNKGLAVHVLAKADVDVVLANLEDLSLATESISRLQLGGGMLGAALFRQPRDQLGSIAMGGMISTLLEKVKADDFSSESIAEYHEAFKIKELSFAKAKVTEKRSCKFTMATLPGEVAVSGTAYERDLNLAIAVREASLGKVGGIPMVPCEAVLVPELCDSAEMSLVPQHLIAGVVDFREMLINDIEKRATTLAKQLDVLRTNWEAYSQCDRFLAIEKSIMEKAQSSVDDKIKSQILARLPCPDKPKLTPGDCLVRVQAIVAHNLYSFANPSLQDQIDLVAETLQLMKDGVSPSDAFGEGQPFLKSVHTTLQHFVRADWVDDEGEPA